MILLHSSSGRWGRRAWGLAWDPPAQAWGLAWDPPAQAWGLAWDPPALAWGLAWDPPAQAWARALAQAQASHQGSRLEGFSVDCVCLLVCVVKYAPSPFPLAGAHHFQQRGEGNFYTFKTAKWFR